MDGEDNSLKCFPLIPRQGKKILFLLVIINVIVIWLIYKKSDYATFLVGPIFQAPILQASTKSISYEPLYDVPIFHIPLLSSKDMNPYYTDISSNTWCLTQGTNIKESKRSRKCQCLPNWFGLDCGIPSSVWESGFVREGKNAGVEIRRRDKPRRIILSIAFDDAFDLLDLNIQNSFSIVDVFLIAENKRNSPSAFNMIKSGFLSEFQRKVMPIQLKESAFIKHEHQRISSMLSDLWSIAWSRLSDFRPDDIFVFSHVSSIISKDILLFLKLYDGYPEPFYFSLRPSLFKFSKVLKSSSKNNTLVPFKPSGCTFEFLSMMCKLSVPKFLEMKCLGNKSRELFFEKTYWRLKEWELGNENFPSGWQCNYCCNSECLLNRFQKQHWITYKMGTLLSGNHLNVNVSVIEQILKQHSFKGQNITYENPKADLYFAPKVVLNSKKYRYLLM